MGVAQVHLYGNVTLRGFTAWIGPADAHNKCSSGALSDGLLLRSLTLIVERRTLGLTLKGG